MRKLVLQEIKTNKKCGLCPNKAELKILIRSKTHTTRDYICERCATIFLYNTFKEAKESMKCKR